MYLNLAVLFGFTLAYSLLAGRLERTPVAGPLLFTAFGALAGPFGLGLLHLDIEAEGLRLLAELTLALVLFTDAASANLGVLRRNLGLPERLLLLGLPLTVLLGLGAALLLFPGLGFVAAALLATMLAPTDAALGKAVVANPAVPAPIREGLNVESGLNDGICVPLLLALLATAAEEAHTGGTVALLARHFVEALGIGAVVGLGLAWAATQVMRLGAARGWLDDTWRQLPVIALALTSFALAQALGGSGFIACFAGGILAGAMARRHKHEQLLAAEGAGDLLSLLTWVVFGAAVVGQGVGRLTPPIIAYAVLSLTVVRMLPVWLALAGTTLRPAEKLFVGWFGPRGLASVVFAVLVLDADVPGSDTLIATVACTVVLSIVLHGLSAGPLAARLAGSGRTG
ncbi:MAG: cation:proton antiporter [Geminicoccaceae bacterium]